MVQEKDNFFKIFFQNKLIIEEFLKYLVKEDWVNDLDFSSLEFVKTDYKSKRMAKRESDVAWKVKYNNYNGLTSELFIVIHIEVQVKNDNTMLLRFLEYIGYFYENMYKSLSKDDKIIPVIPILLHIGKDNWNAKTKFHDLVNFTDERLKKYIINFEYFPVILKDISKEELLEAESLFTRLLALNKSINEKDFKDTFEKLFNIVFQFKDVNDRKRLRNLISLYVEEAINLNKVKKDKLLEIIDNYNMEGDMLSWNLDHVFEEAEQRGIEKGKKEERIELVKRMLRANIDVKQISEISGLFSEEIKGLEEVNNG
jgi:predicted transposase/invertase (TIGR01784 family)